MQVGSRNSFGGSGARVLETREEWGAWNASCPSASVGGRVTLEVAPLRVQGLPLRQGAQAVRFAGLRSTIREEVEIRRPRGTPDPGRGRTGDATTSRSPAMGCPAMGQREHSESEEAHGSNERVTGATLCRATDLMAE
jgi:hypothetical protein